MGWDPHPFEAWRFSSVCLSLLCKRDLLCLVFFFSLFLPCFFSLESPPSAYSFLLRPPPFFWAYGDVLVPVRENSTSAFWASFFSSRLPYTTLPIILSAAERRQAWGVLDLIFSPLRDLIYTSPPLLSSLSLLFSSHLISSTTVAQMINVFFPPDVFFLY